MSMTMATITLPTLRKAGRWMNSVGSIFRAYQDGCGVRSSGGPPTMNFRLTHLMER